MKIINPLLFTLVAFFVLFSCAVPHYQHTYESTKGLDLRNGKWLVNSIETDLSLNSTAALTKKLLKKFKGLVGDSAVYIDSISLKYILPFQMQFELSPETLASLKCSTDFDYVLNVKANRIRDDIGSVMIPPNFSYAKNEAEVYIDVYEIISGQRIYSQRIVASVSISENEDKVHFTKSANGLIYGALGRGMKKIKKWSIRN